MSPTHKVPCVVCGEECWCTSDTHALGCGGSHGTGGCHELPYIEFCSEACAVELQRRLVNALRHYREVIAIGVP